MIASNPAATFFAALGRWFGRRRWKIQLMYLAARHRKAVRIAVARFWRKPLIEIHYRHKDFAPAPSMITLRVTNSCNLRCKQCAQWGERGVFKEIAPNRGSEMTTSEWQTFIQQIAPTCPHIYFFGGEPFARPDLLELIRCATKHNVATGLNTNGTLLRTRAEEVVASGLDYIIVSLDGPRETNNLIRIGKSDTFGLIRTGIEELIRMRKKERSPFPLLEVFMTVTVENQAEILTTARLARSLEADYFAVELGIFTTEALAAASSAEFMADFGIKPHFYSGFVRDMSRVVPEVIERQLYLVRREWGDRYKQYPPIDCDLKEYFHHPELVLRDKQCLAPWLTMQVMPDGIVTFCEDFADLACGDVRVEHPLSIWNNETSRTWRNRIRTKGIFPAETRCGAFYLS